MKLKYGTIAQLRNIIRWLQNYQSTGYRLCDVTPRTSDEQIQARERKLRADDFQPPENVEDLIDELRHIVADYHEGMTLDGIQSEWEAIRPRLKQVFHEARVLPEIIVEKIPTNE
jgi:hypothetical protein